MRWSALRESLLETAMTIGMIFLLLLGAEMLKIFMSRAGVPQATATWLGGSGLDPMTVMILLLVALILLACLLDSLSMRSEEHTSELQSLMRSSYAVFCLTQKQSYTCNAPHYNSHINKPNPKHRDS